MTPYEQFIFVSRYARYVPALGRRETWNECIDRYICFFKDKFPDTKVPWTKLFNAIQDRDVMPSMRALMTAGPALTRDNVAGYNCAYLAIDNLRCFDEIMYILMCGTGVGFSVERQYINKLPEVAEEFHDVDTTIKVRDSKIGWASAYRQLIGLLYQGAIPQWDTSTVRPAGAILKTFGGRASGPEPLEELFRFTISQFRGAAGRRLNSLEVHDTVCKVADVVVCGGVRRSALLSLSNLTDQRMRSAKTGEWHSLHPQRALANNSVCYTEKPDMGIFLAEWISLYESKSGERGIFNRKAANEMLPERREGDHEWGTNPCSEIVLRNKQFCNLSEVIVRGTDSLDDLKRKVEIATILGTLQATVTDFRYLSAAWKRNTEEERLLGVSLTGIMDHGVLAGVSLPTKLMDDACEEDSLRSILEELRDVSIKTNRRWAKSLGIPESTAITCVKPSGTVSQLCNTSSGIHPRYAEYYIRRVRADAKDPVCSVLDQAGVPSEVGRTNSNEVIYSFPIKSPEGAICVDKVDAISQLEHWKTFAVVWCEHKPSVSIYVREHEWLTVGAWVYKNWEIMNGVSFFPFDDHLYQQAPYEPITKEEYDVLVKALPTEIDFTFKEEEDNTVSSQELACVGGACEL
jgi:ribonucleoside-triphosphate reductase